jgi:hypothetical protein
MSLRELDAFRPQQNFRHASSSGLLLALEILVLDT